MAQEPKVSRASKCKNKEATNRTNRTHTYIWTDLLGAAHIYTHIYIWTDLLGAALHLAHHLPAAADELPHDVLGALNHLLRRCITCERGGKHVGWLEDHEEKEGWVL